MQIMVSAFLDSSPFEPQIPCLSHVPAIISTQKTPEGLLSLQFKALPTTLLKLDDIPINIAVFF